MVSMSNHISYHAHDPGQKSNIFQDQKKNTPCRHVLVKWLVTASLSKGFDLFTLLVSPSPKYKAEYVYPLIA